MTAQYEPPSGRSQPWTLWPSEARETSETRATGRGASAPARRTGLAPPQPRHQDRKSTRLNSSHTVISYAVFCLKKKKKKKKKQQAAQVLYDTLTTYTTVHDNTCNTT